MSNDKTLADAQPGGRVRLGDQAERARFEAWGEERELDTAKCSADGMKGDYADLNTDWCWAAWQAAISAQPSPGGRGDAPFTWNDRAKADALEAGQYAFTEADGKDLGYTACIEACVDAICLVLEMPEHRLALAARQPAHGLGTLVDSGALQMALNVLRRAGKDEVAHALEATAARQPVGEPVGYFDPDVLAHLTEGLIDPVGVLRRKPNGKSNVPVWLRPTAQAVDLGPSIPSELAPVAAALKRFDECAEDCGSEGCDIGRAWFDALTTMGLLRRTQRSPAVWTMTAEGERLLALIDCQAVGK